MENRPIVMKFRYNQQRELVRITAITKTGELKSAGIGVGIQQTKAVLQQRREKSALFYREKKATSLLMDTPVYIYLAISVSESKKGATAAD